MADKLTKQGVRDLNVLGSRPADRTNLKPCPDCEGNRGHVVYFDDYDIAGSWEPCRTCGGTGKVYVTTRWRRRPT